MKYMIASDIHGSVEAIKTLLNRFEEEKADKLILLGDLYYHGPRNPLPNGYQPVEAARLLNTVKDRLMVTRGNCDSEADQTISQFKLVPVFSLKSGGLTLVFTHGHKFNINNPPSRGFDILFYGHEHTGYIKEKDGRLYVNSGSTSLPKGGTPASYCTLEGRSVCLKELESGKVLDSAEI